MKSRCLKTKQVKRAILIFSIIMMLSGAFIRQGSAQVWPYYPPFVSPYFGGFPLVPPPFYGYGPYYGYQPARSAAVILPITTLLPTLLAPTTTTTAAPVIGISTAITLATLGGTGLSATALVALSTTPVPTTVTTTPTIGITTALLLLSSGGISTTTLLLLGI